MLNARTPLDIYDDWKHWNENPYPDFFLTTFNAPCYVFAYWSRWFRIRAHELVCSLDYQDFVLLERLADDNLRTETLRPAISGEVPA